MTSDEEQAILRAILNLFERWELTAKQSSELLGVFYEMWKIIRSGDYTVSLTEDQAMRAGALMGIHLALRTIFTEPRCYNWVVRPNRDAFFAVQPAIKLMIAGGLPSIIRVRQYLLSELAC